MLPTRLDKLQGHAEHLLDLFVGLREKYAILRPMIFDRTVIDALAGGASGRGFMALRTTLFTSCILDIAKVTDDSDERTPSVRRLVESLSEDPTKTSLREAYAVWNLPTNAERPAVEAVLRRMEAREQEERRAQFVQHLSELQTRWEEIKASKDLKSCAVIRDKLLAHSELHHDGAQYRPFDVASLGLKWDALESLIADLQPIIDLITLVFRSSSFAFDMLDEQLESGADGFWSRIRDA